MPKKNIAGLDVHSPVLTPIFRAEYFSDVRLEDLLEHLGNETLDPWYWDQYKKGRQEVVQAMHKSHDLMLQTLTQEN